MRHSSCYLLRRVSWLCYHNPLLNQGNKKKCKKWLAVHISYIHKLARPGIALTAGVHYTVTIQNCLLNSIAVCTRASQTPSVVNNTSSCATACMPLWLCSNTTNAIAVRRLMTSHDRGVIVCVACRVCASGQARGVRLLHSTLLSAVCQ